MWIYALKRLVAYIPVYLAVMAFITYVSWEHMDVIDAQMDKYGTQRERQEFIERYELSGNILVRNLKKLWYTARFQFGDSLNDKRSVRSILWERGIISVTLTLPALILSTLIGVCLGLISAFFRGRAMDRGLMMMGTIGMSISFLVYIIVLQYLLVLKVELFPAPDWGDSFAESIHFLILPILIQVLVSLGYDSRFYRAVMVEESTRDYIITAYAKGVSRRRVIFVHMLKNAMIPIITRFFIAMPFLFMGSFLLETFFRIPGLGATLISSITGKTDPPLIIGATALLCSFYLLFLIITDILYAVVDPRVRLE